MNQLFKTLSYTVDRCHYLVQPTRTQIKLTIQDFDKKVKYFCEISNDLLPEALDAAKIYQEMVKQHIYSNKQPSNMLRCQKGSLIVSFDYPRCQFRRFEFPCQRRSTNQFELRLEQVKKYFQQSRLEMKELSQRFMVQIENTTTEQLSRIDKIIGEKLQQITAKIDLASEMKVRQLQDFYNTNRREHESQMQQAIKKSMIQVMASNESAIKQFRFVNQRFEATLLTLQTNIDSLHQSLEELRDQMDENKEWTQDQIADVSMNIEETAKAIWKRLKEMTEPKQINRQRQQKEWEPAYEGAESSVSEDMFPKLSTIKQESHHEKTIILDKGGIGPLFPSDTILPSKEASQYPEPSLT